MAPGPELVSVASAASIASPPPSTVVSAAVPKESAIALLTLAGIGVHLTLRYALGIPVVAYQVPLWLVLSLGGGPLVYGLGTRLLRREFGSDLLAGISIVTAVILGQYLAGSLVVLMLSGGGVLEAFAVRRASGVLEALARRMPSIAHVRREGSVLDLSIDAIRPGDIVLIYPHEICPVDGVVVEGHGVMDESYLTGEPFEISKTPGVQVLSGAINGETALTIRASKLAVDSRYAGIMRVMRAAQQNRPRIRRLGDELGAYYTPLALALAALAWIVSHSPLRFLGVLVIATPCPLLIAIPVSIIGTITLAAKRGIVVRDPSVLERLDTCRTIIFDKTGTLTYGVPELTGQILAPGFDSREVLGLVSSLERYSKHPLARAVLNAAQKSDLTSVDATRMSETAGQGLGGLVGGRKVRVTSREILLRETGTPATALPPPSSGLECAISIDDNYAGVYQFHDSPRRESRPFIRHLGRRHRFDKVMLVSGDRQAEVSYLANLVGVGEIHASKTPEEKVEIVRRETADSRTLFLGDGINDAPALMTASVGIAFGPNSDVTSEAAGAVIMEASLERVDEFFHIGRRMRRIALESAVGGMLLSVAGMLLAASGILQPVTGAVAQEIIDVLAIANALRAAWPPKVLTDF